jgi:hypothetical protein
MELTYEKMKKHIEDYFDCLPDMEKGGPEAVALIKPFFSKDSTVRRNEPPQILPRDKWLKHLARGSYVYKIFVRPPDGYCIIDPRNGWTFIFMREEVHDVDDDKLVREIRNSVHFRLAIEDGSIKFVDEVITRVPGNFQLDKIDERYMGCGSFYFDDAKLDDPKKKNSSILTYRNMLDHTQKYFDAVRDSDVNDKKSIAELEYYFSRDVKVRHLDWPLVESRKEWIEGYLCKGNYKYSTHWRSPDGYVAIDDRLKMAGARIREQIADPVTGEIICELLNTYHIGFADIGGSVKIDSMLITRIPALFQVDTLPDKKSRHNNLIQLNQSAT